MHLPRPEPRPRGRALSPQRDQSEGMQSAVTDAIRGHRSRQAQASEPGFGALESLQFSCEKPETPFRIQQETVGSLPLALTLLIPLGTAGRTGVPSSPQAGQPAVAPGGTAWPRALCRSPHAMAAPRRGTRLAALGLDPRSDATCAERPCWAARQVPQADGQGGSGGAGRPRCLGSHSFQSLGLGTAVQAGAPREGRLPGSLAAAAHGDRDASRQDNRPVTCPRSSRIPPVVRSAV